MEGFGGPVRLDRPDFSDIDPTLDAAVVRPERSQAECRSISPPTTRPGGIGRTTQEASAQWVIVGKLLSVLLRPQQRRWGVWCADGGQEASGRGKGRS